MDADTQGEGRTLMEAEVGAVSTTKDTKGCGQYQALGGRRGPSPGTLRGGALPWDLTSPLLAGPRFPEVNALRKMRKSAGVPPRCTLNVSRFKTGLCSQLRPFGLCWG